MNIYWPIPFIKCRYTLTTFLVFVNNCQSNNACCGEFVIKYLIINYISWMSRKFSKRGYFLPFSHLDADVFVHISTFEYAIPFRCNTRFDQLSEIRARRKTPSFQRHINLKGSKSVVNCSILGNAEHFFIPSRCISPCGNILLPEFMPFLTNRKIGILV